jgi:hypothetical protein
MTWRRVLLAVAACGALAACTSVHSNMTINGRLFGPDHCKNGEEEEFFGVDLKDERGMQLRLVANPDETVTVVVIPDGAQPYAATGCAHLNLDRGSNDKSGHYEVSGDAYVDCVAGPYEVRGSTSFDNCYYKF